MPRPELVRDRIPNLTDLPEDALLDFTTSSWTSPLVEVGAAEETILLPWRPGLCAVCVQAGEILGFYAFPPGEPPAVVEEVPLVWVESARMVVSALGERRPFTHGTLFLVFDGPPSLPPISWQSAIAYLECDGTATLSGFPPGRFGGEVHAHYSFTPTARFHGLLRPGRTTHVRMVVDRGIAVRGRVVDPALGEDKTGVLLVWNANGYANRDSDIPVAEDGSFVVSGLREGETYRACFLFASDGTSTLIAGPEFGIFHLWPEFRAEYEFVATTEGVVLLEAGVEGAAVGD